ncbi:hypothetical protein SAMN04488102_10314 [Alkalibacterium subtropicum]|uniref:DUF8173 domain-containing protein n=1 Tax=Alkalibacterium subtropicum TaxID=753702 RepID=A0A1I1GD62_9LACT|nr:hypothetical protein [Alkalibacterium subtropicum]SFC09406.1 hypothetical protein SAMN04488102_10314 [Alkalibacterium subtropicum]
MKNFSVNSRTRRLSVIILFLLSLVTLAGTVSARPHMFNREARQIHQENETLDGPGFFAGDNVRIDGDINGTAFASGDNVEVNGDINGALFVIGGSVRVNGEVNGNIYGLGQTIRFSGQNEGEVFLAGERVTIDQAAQSGRDVFTAGMDVFIDGDVPRHLFAAGENVALNSMIGGDANVSGEDITLSDSVSIEGDFFYESPSEAEIAQNATIAGQTDYSEREPWNTMQMTIGQRERWLFRILYAIWYFLSALVIWLVIRLLRPHYWTDNTRPIATTPLKTMGFGLLSVIATPFVILFLMITIIGIPMGIILALLYGIAIAFSKIVVATFIGSYIFKASDRESFGKEFLIVLSGLLILDLLILIPYVGWVVRLFVGITGVGALVLFRHEPTEAKHAEY